VLFACNGDGSDKLPLVIGKFKVHVASRMTRDCLQNIKLI
jgi:hypothetical protein